MTLQRAVLRVAAVIGLWRLGMATSSWAHHPIPSPKAGAEWPWPLLWFLGAGVFMVAFVATWAIFSFFDHRQQLQAGERKSSRRS